MHRTVYRYAFDGAVPFDDVEAALLLSLWGTESLCGEARTRLDAAHAADAAKRTCVIDAGTAVGRTLNRLFVGFVRRECGDESFSVTRLDRDAGRPPVGSAAEHAPGFDAVMSAAGR